MNTVTVSGWPEANLAERLDLVGQQHERPVMAPDAHLEAAYEDRYELDEAP
jgi:hypothetical protein